MTTLPSYDLIIIGGGITGAAIARDAAQRGASVLCLEKNTWGSGSSTKTSKLVHGGLRYLEQFQFKLTAESLKERELALELSSQFVQPLPIIFPVYKGDKRPHWFINIGLTLYDWLSRSKFMPKHSSLSARALASKVPSLKRDALTGGSVFYDAQMHDQQWTAAIIHDAQSHGATCINHATVTQLHHDNGQLYGVTWQHNGQSGNATASVIINATGVWADQLRAMAQPNISPRLSPTKGVHIMFPDLGFETGFILSTPQDDRIFFILPWEGYTIIGTTDTDFPSEPENLSVSQADIDYLIEAAQHYFPNGPFNHASFLKGFVGLRPLLRSEKDPSQRSRDFLIETLDCGLISVMGGKYTTHRHMAEKAVDKAFQKIRNVDVKVCKTHVTPLIPFGIKQAFENGYFQKIGHRGYPVHEKENTLNSFLKAHQAGATMIETDLQRDAYGKIILHHDDIRSVQTPPIPYPLFSELLEALSNQVFYYVELKIFDWMNTINKEDLVKKTLAIIADKKLDEHCMIVSFDVECLNIARAKHSTISLALNIDTLDKEVLIETHRQLNLLAVGPNIDQLTQEDMHVYKQQGLYVAPYTVNTPDQFKKAFDLNVDGITTDDMGRLLRYLKT